MLEESGNDSNYRWITGVLERHPADPSVWVLHYAPPQVIDRYKGAVVLQTNANMSQFREGDLLSVSGYILSNVKITPTLNEWGYAADHVDMVKRP